jgi:ribosomal protein L19E
MCTRVRDLADDIINVSNGRMLLAQANWSRLTPRVGSMTTENDVRRIIRTVTASVQRALGGLGRPAEQRHARPKLEGRNGYGSRPQAGEPVPRQ